MFSGKLIRFLSVPTIAVLLLIIISASFPLLSGFAYPKEPNNQNQESLTRLDKPDWLQADPIIKFLGKSFGEIKELLGEPQHEGYSSWNGPHRYLIYQFDNSKVRFNSPLDLADNIVVSIIMEGELEIAGARVGMHFSEIRKAWGEPDYGPERGLDNSYFMDYYLGEKDDQTPEIFISFAAGGIDSPTLDVFIKWEAFDYESLAGSMQYQL
jgi:hypothetical protein